MSLQFVIEDGVGRSNATSYASVAQFRQYWENRGVTYTDLDPAVSVWLNRATEWIDNNFSWFGEKVNPIQALDFPRVGVRDPKSTVCFESNIVPKPIVTAVCYLAAIAKTITDDLDPVSDTRTSESYGSSARTFSTPGSNKKIYSKVYKILCGLYKTGIEAERVW